MGKFTQIPQRTFGGLQLEAGILLYKFDPETGEFDDKDMICATTGGIAVACVPTTSNLADDIDNAGSFMETVHIDSWACTIGFTSLDTSPESIRLSLGAADINSDNTQIVPRRDLKLTDFRDVWWVGDRADGGMVAVRLMNALSTAGFSLKTTKNGKGQNTMTLTGHISMTDQDTVPMLFYSSDPSYTIRYDLQDVESSAKNTAIKKGESYTTKLTATGGGYEVDDESVKIIMGGSDVTATAYTADGDTVSIEEAEGDIIIIAKATEE